MPIRTNLKSLTPRREAYKKEIQLLSRGFSAPQNWPDGKLTVYPWDSSVDDFLLTETRKGTSREEILYALVGKLADLNGADIDTFVLSEVSTVLLVARSIRRENRLSYRSKCPACNAEADETISVPGELTKIGAKEAGYTGSDSVTLPGCKDVVELRPLLVRDQKKIVLRDQDTKRRITDTVCAVLMPIVAIGGGRPDSIEEVYAWYMALSPDDADFLERKEDELSPHLDARIAHRCEQCGKDFFHMLGLDQEFFRSGSPAKP